MLKLLDTRYHHGDGFEESSCLSLLSIVLMVFFIVLSISYATWILIDATRIADISGIHITKNLVLAVDNFKGKLYTDKNRGIKDWMIHTDKSNGFEIKHPNDWEMQTGQKNNLFLFLKTYKNIGSDAKSKALLMTVELKGLEEGVGGRTLQDIRAEEGFISQDVWKEEIINGRLASRTGRIKTADGLLKDAIFWKPVENQKGFYLEATYYTDDINDTKYNEAIFNNVISEFKFL
jgi:hypothetical protein